jgi:hypothetical protein
MVTNALRAYLQLATGLTEVTKQKATDAAKQLSAQLGVQGDEAMATAGAVASIASQQIQILTDDLLAAAKTNRKLLTDLVQFEVDRGATQLARLDPQQLEGLLAAVRRLADEVASLTGVSRSKTSAPSAKTPPANRTKATDARPLATKKTAKKATKKTAKKAAAKAPSTEPAQAKKAAKKAPAKKTAAKKAPAKKAPAKAAPEPVLELVPEQVIDLAPEPTVDSVIESAPAPVLETVPQAVAETVEPSTESSL